MTAVDITAATAATSDLAAAKGTEQAAEAAALTALVGALSPLVATLGDRPLIAQSHVVDKGGEKFRRYGYRCIPLSAATTADLGPTLRGARDDHGGPYRGEDLLLDQQGQLVQLTYRGRWNRWQGARDWWRATVTVLTPEAAIAADWDVEALTANASEWLTARLATVAAEAEAARKSAAKLERVAAALRAAAE